MPRVHWPHGLNPPGRYTDHAADIQRRFEGAELAPGSSLEILYGVAPCAELIFTIPGDDVRAVAQFARGLSEDESSHLRGAGPATVWYTAEEWDERFGEGSRQAS
ncbi:MAG TPA: hypothetical protein VGJ77_16680 [Gaiellaceae bacterium]|jgi:hypothetical protein